MRIWHNPLEFIFPRKCLLCRNKLEDEERDFCSDCLHGTPRFTDESRRVRNMDKCMVLWYYEGPVRQALLRYKFSGKEHYGAAFGRLLGDKIRSWYGGNFDIVTYVPVSFQRNIKRGYDQVQIISRYVCKTLGCQLVPTLRKIRHNAAQSSLESAKQRYSNVTGAYKVIHPEAVCGKRVLIIDDIITTGSTLSECGKVLREAGASSVFCVAVAAGHRKSR